MRKILVAALLGLFASASAAANADVGGSGARSKSVLFVLSASGKEQGQVRPGFEMDELAQAWSVFQANDVRTAFASPHGGAVEADKFNPEDTDNSRFIADPVAMAALDETLALGEVDPGQYDAIYVVGGKGAMLDLATNKTLTDLIGKMYAQGSIVAAICHGSAALANVRMADGRYLVQGRAVTGFSAEEEAVFGKKGLVQFPFQIEQTLRARGGLWQEAPLMMPGVAIDGRLVTGQNPYSTMRVAEAVLRALEIVPVERAPRKDEASLALIERAVQGDSSAAAVLSSALHDYQPELIAVIGHYQLQAAQDQEAVRAALIAMDLAAPHVQANELSVSRAEALWRLGRTGEAQQILDGVLAKAPDMSEALKLQAKLQARQ